MKYARVPRPEAPAGPLSAGIDWASADHAVCIVDATGAVVSRFTVAHTAEGLRTLVQCLARAGETGPVARQHALFFLRLAEEAEQERRGSQERMWLDRLAQEMDNLRAALD